MTISSYKKKKKKTKTKKKAPQNPPKPKNEVLKQYEPMRVRFRVGPEPYTLGDGELLKMSAKLDM